MEDYKSQTSNIQELANNPQKLSDHLTDNTEALYAAAPGITQAIHGTIANGVQFLNSKISKPSNQFLLSHDHEPSKQTMTDFGHYYKAVDDPVSILDHVKDGTLSDKHMEALSAVHPHLLQEMRTKIFDNMTKENTENLPYQRKMSISKFIGQPIDGNMTGQALLSNQASLSGPELSQQSTGKTSRKTAVAGFKEWAAPKRAATETQEEREE